MSQILALQDLARIKGKKVLSKMDIECVSAHLKTLKDLYESYALNVEVLTRRFEKQPQPYQFKPGDKVIYVPVYANGDVNHPNCERGVVSSVSDGDNGVQNVWVRYNEGSTGAKTAYDSLVLDV